MTRCPGKGSAQMKRKLLLAIGLWPSCFLSAQDTLSAAELPAVEIVSEIAEISLDQPDSVAWTRHRTSDIGRLLGAEGLANAMAYGPAGTAVLLRTHGTSPDHTSLTWHGLPLQSLSLGMADCSLVPAFFFDGVGVTSGVHSDRFTAPAIGGEVALLSSPVSKGWSAEVLGEYNSLGNRFLGARIARAGPRWSSDTRILQHDLRNRFRYTDRYRLGTPELEQDRNDGRLHGLSQRFGWSLGRHRVGLEGWYTRRGMQLPAVMGMVQPRLTDQQDEQVRMLVHHRMALRRQAYSVETVAAFLSDGQVYTERTISSEEDDLRFSTRGRHILAGSGITAQWARGWHGRLSAQFQRLEVRYDDRRNALLDAWSMVLHAGRKGRKQEVKASGRLEQRSGQQPALSGFAAWSTIPRRPQMPVFRLEYSERLRLPDFNELFWQPGGNPLLRPERSRGVHFTAEGRLPAVQATWKAECFYTAVRDWIQWLPGPDMIWSPVNYREVHTGGVEGALFHVRRLRRAVLEANLRYQWNRAVGNAREPGREAFFMVYTPAHRVSGGMNWRRGPLSVWLSGRWVGERYTDEANSRHMTLPAFFLGDAGMNWTSEGRSLNWSLGMRVENFMDTRYELVRAYALPGRVVQCSLSVTFKSK